MIRAVFFDLDGTLYDRDAAILEVARLQFETFRLDMPDITEDLFIERLLMLDGHGHKRTPRLHHVLAEELRLPAALADRLEACFRSFYPRCCRLTEDTRTTLQALRIRGMKLGLITNGPSYWQSLKIETLGIRPLFDTIVISGSEGIEKPDPRIFARALERCGVAACESMFVGDHPDADIQGARAAGLRPVWKRMGYWQVPDGIAIIEQISEILTLIG